MARYFRLIHRVLERSFTNAQNKSSKSIVESAQRHFRSAASLSSGVKDEIKVDVEPSKSKVVVSRKMGREDTQMYGMVHGGVVMQLLEEAGTILAMQYCNANEQSNTGSDKSPRVVTLSACVEKLEILQPLFIGEEAEVHAELGYTSKHSVQTFVEVYAKNPAKGQPRVISRAKIWYVPQTNEKISKLASVPPRTYTDPAIEVAGSQSYLELKNLRDKIIKPRLNPRALPREELRYDHHDPERQSVNYSLTIAQHAIYPSNCWADQNYLRGGVAMKWMDEAGSYTASLHSSFPGLTVSVENMMLLRKVRVGAIIIITSKPIFSSQKSLEVMITADEFNLHPGLGMYSLRAIEGIFTFVAVDEKGKTIEMPPLKLKTEEEFRVFEERKNIYEQRQKHKKQQQQQQQQRA